MKTVFLHRRNNSLIKLRSASIALLSKNEKSTIDVDCQIVLFSACLILSQRFLFSATALLYVVFGLVLYAY